MLSPPPSEPPKVLTIAGSDSGGAAGLQADLRTFAALRVYGTCVLTVATAQNSILVEAVQPLPAEFVAAQLDAVLADYGVVGGGIRALKTGFVGRIDLVEMIASRLARYRLPNVVVDPVLANHRGKAMFPPAVTQAYVASLLPLATLVTPNWREAGLLAGVEVAKVADLETAVSRLHASGPHHVLITGFHDGDEVLDVFSDGTSITYLRSPRIETINTHGSGDTLSAAICAYLARGEAVETAVYRARQFTAVAIQRAAAWRLGQGHGPVWQVTEE